MKTPPWSLAGASLRRWREQAGLSVQGVATMCLTSRQVVERWESGRRRPDFLNAVKLEVYTHGAVTLEAWRHDEHTITLVELLVTLRRTRVAA